MYVKTGRKNNSTRFAGLIAVVAMNGLVFWIAASGFGAAVMKEITETQVAIIEEVQEEEEPPPPPPPVEVELPPPPPSVILPDFVFERPVVETAIQQAPMVKDPPRPVDVRPPPPPLPPVAPSCREKSPCAKKMGEFMVEYYPAASIRAEEQGAVKVSACLDAAGRPSNVQLVKSSGVPRLDEATVKNMPKMKFTPAKDAAGKDVAWCNPPFVVDIVWQLPKR